MLLGAREGGQHELVPVWSLAQRTMSTEMIYGRVDCFRLCRKVGRVSSANAFINSLVADGRRHKSPAQVVVLSLYVFKAKRRG